MANTVEMLRLIRHAADLLDSCDPTLNAESVAANTHIADVRRDAARRAMAETVAMGTASTVLRMVAACIEDEPAAARSPEVSTDG